MKQKLIECFHTGGIYETYKSGNYEKNIYPTIHSARIKDNYLEYVFTLINGYDPKEIKKKEYVFYQFFGRTLEINSDGIKKYILKIYGNELKGRIDWNFDLIEPHIKGLHVPIVCGKNLNNEMITFDLIKNPHLLISGTTGSGKSTQLRSILMTLITAMSPDNLELYLSDLKMAEFAFFRNVRHVKELCMTSKETKKMLQGVIKELDRRQQLIVDEGVTHVKDLKCNKVPNIIVAIDEFATLHDKEAMEDLLEISNRGRALSINLVLSILRPDAKTLDSRLKNNLNATMGFKTRNRTNANVIGTPGAENLKGDGRFLLDSVTVEGMPELQALYLDEDRLKELLVPYKIAEAEEAPSVETWTFPNNSTDLSPFGEKLNTDVAELQQRKPSQPVIRQLTIEDLKKGRD